MPAKRSGHGWHIVPMVAIVAAASWLGARGAVPFAMSAGTAVAVALVWLASSAGSHRGRRADPTGPKPHPSP